MFHLNVPTDLIRMYLNTAEKLHQSLDAVNNQGMRTFIIYLREIRVRFTLKLTITTNLRWVIIH